MKVLITGSEGFIGSYLCAEFESNGYEVIRCDIVQKNSCVLMDIMNRENVKDVLIQYRPDVLINLAGQPNVSLSWIQPQATVQLNTIGVINVLESVKEVNPDIRVITIGSSDEYGILINKANNITEDVSVNPITPYAISKYTQELFAKMYFRTYGMNICMARLFNLSGGGQAKGFLIPDLASGIAEIENGKRNYLSVGYLESARDFLHVKDACRALRLIAEKGHSGEIYNICSGVAHKAQEILDMMISMSTAKIEVVQDQTKMRPSDIPIICGNHDKLTEHTDWAPSMDFNSILLDALMYWRKQTRNQ